jgi:tetratricopeptide (TPR) repeat protein
MQTILCLLTGWLLSVPVWADVDTLHQAVTAYRQGQFSRALSALTEHHKLAKPTAKSLYYQAITTVQLGQPEQAAALYEQIITTYPGTAEAQLAQTGLNNLASLTQPDLDTPPGTTPSQNHLTMPSLTAEQLQLQGVMSMLGSSNTGNNQDMAMWNLMMHQNQQPGQGGNTTIDPNVMSTMLMNQFMGQLDMGSNNQDNR